MTLEPHTCYKYVCMQEGPVSSTTYLFNSFYLLGLRSGLPVLNFQVPVLYSLCKIGYDVLIGCFSSSKLVLKSFMTARPKVGCDITLEYLDNM